MKFGTFHLMERPFSKSEPQVYREQLAHRSRGGGQRRTIRV